SSRPVRYLPLSRPSRPSTSPIPPPPSPTLFPYTTLFRSQRKEHRVRRNYHLPPEAFMGSYNPCYEIWSIGVVLVAMCTKRYPFRSEEHTSELQSRFDLVCRLLLEKKKKRRNGPTCMGTFT